MKMVRNLLLGSAAGLVAIGGAQAADLPVKAKPVQYVKICSLYGAGYYYIPGSDTCIRFGGYVRADYGYNLRGARTPHYAGASGARDRTVPSFSTRHRANLSIDTRTQTSYGTLRTFTSIHFNNEDGANSTPTLARAMIQWAGFTFGHAQSFQDTWGITDSWHYTQQQNDSTTGANGVNQIAYTWELGNGMTFTLGADEVRRKSLTNASSSSAFTIGSEPSNTHAGMSVPDLYGAFKINQAWGYWATSVVAHKVSATYWQCDGTAASDICGYPDDKWGWAIQTGGEFKLGMIAPGDRFGFVARYGQGASAFSGGSNLASPSTFGGGNKVAIGFMTDGIYTNDNQIELTTTWSVGAGYEHNWTPNLKTSFTGEYTKVLYNDVAAADIANRVCPGAEVPRIGLADTSCDPNWSFFQGGIRTQWTPVAGFILGVDLAYTKVFTAFKGADATLNTVTDGEASGNVLGGHRSTGDGGPLYRVADQDVYSVIFRAQRNFNAGD
jgi:hypothetical protein